MLEKLFRVEGDAADDEPAPRPVAPGRVPLTARLLPPFLYRKRSGAGGVDDGAEDAVARAAGSSGAPLPADVRARFEQSLGADLSTVRVHTGAASARAASAVGARAYTVGADIHFAEGQYAPTDPFGLHLLAHEVAHTQQRGAVVARKEVDGAKPGDDKELSELRKGLLAEFDELNKSVVGDKRHDAIMKEDSWNDTKNKEWLQEVAHDATLGAISPPAIYTTCIGTQAVVLARAMAKAKQTPKGGHTDFAWHMVHDPDAYHKADIGETSRPRPGDVLILASPGAGVENAQRQQQSAQFNGAQAAQDEGRAQAKVEQADTAVKNAVAALGALKAAETDPKADGWKRKAAIQNAEAAVRQARMALGWAQNHEAQTSKTLDADKKAEATADQRVDDERAKAKQGKRYFDFRHTCFLAGAIHTGDDGLERWPVFGGGATVNGAPDSKKGGGAEKGELIYDPATNELRDPELKARPTFLWGWCDADKMAV
jgi:hypothetical protein